MNNEIMKALEVLKNNCKKYEDCIGCVLYDIDTYGCYLTERVPEDYNLEKLEKFEIESECKE